MTRKPDEMLGAVGDIVEKWKDGREGGRDRSHFAIGH